MKALILGVSAAALLSVAALSLEDRGPIVILSDEDFTPENGVVGGSGTPDDPYVISGWRIERGDYPFGIHIRGVKAPFLIRDVEVYGARVAGIKIEASRYGRIEGVRVKGSPTGILVAMSRDLWFRGAVVDDCDEGIRAIFSQSISFEGLHIEDCKVGIWFGGVTDSVVTGTYVEAELGVLLEMGSRGNLFFGNGFFAGTPVRTEGGNSWDNGTYGNYWSVFQGPDNDEDGIIDFPFRIHFETVDRYPLVSFPPPFLQGPP